MKTALSITLLGLAGVLLTSAGPHASGASVDAEFFEQKIRPILAEKCFECHSADSKSLKGNLLLDSRDGMLKGGDTGPSIVPGAPDKSLLISAIHYADPETAMPPKKAGGKLPAGVIADINAWVLAGAPWPETATSAKKTSKKFDLAQRKQDHWCWKPPVSSPAPNVRDSAWPRSNADRFILAKLEAAGLQPAPAADKNTLLRRVTFDLTGLPPSPKDLARFLEDTSPEAFSKAVDRLLAAPQFGERWARHWMDLVRYAESRGHEFDHPIPNAWQYRDYLVRSFNEDVPYDRFVKEHIAGDLIPARLQKTTGANESILGTGFWFLTEEVHSPVDLRQDEVDRIDNRVDVMSKTFLGLTVACARCHDHKFDAISQKDYYALTGFLISSSQRLVRFETMEQERKAAEAAEAIRREISPALAQATARVLGAGIESLPATLQSVRDAFLARKEPGEPLAAAWSTELKAAQQKPEHVLHAFAKTWLSASPVLPAALKTSSEPASSAPSTQPAPDTRVLADYTSPSPSPWIQDGFAFGKAPTRAGTIIPGPSPDSPIEAVATVTAARRHPAWREISSKGDRDPGRLGELQRSGQTLRTPEFTINGGSLWYLVRGAGSAYSVVESHLMVGGPLHGKVVTTWENSGRWDWVKHDLSAYSGHRAHVELMPKGKEDFEVAMVVESSEKPPLPTALADLKKAFSTNGSDAVASLQTALRSSAAFLKNWSEESASACSPQDAALANWMVHALDLFCPPTSPERLALAQAVRPLIERYQTAATSFPNESQLATAMFEGSGVDEFLLKRGSPKTPVSQVPRRFIEAIAGPKPLAPAIGSGRRELAETIASPANPLTARVIVNRVWHHLFGRGIVPTVDNFGVLGQEPSHQELLDTLAVHFTTDLHWSLKALIRELVLSSTYAMGSQPASVGAEEKDPQNVLLHRMNLKRLEGEAIRDAILSVSGRIDLTTGGPSVPIFITPFMEGRGRPKSGPLDGDGRRSVYIGIKRNFLSPMMLAFDTPIPFNTMGRRNVSNVPAQSLVMMNDPFVVQQAGVWAKNLEPKASPEDKLRSMYLSAFAREPVQEERADALLFIREQANSLNVSTEDPAVWADLAHVLFNAKEFIHLN